MEEAGNLEASSQFSPAPKRKINKRFIYVIAAVIVIVLLFGIFKFLNPDTSNNNNINSDINSSFQQEPVIDTPTLTETPTLQVTETPSPTQTPTPKPTSNPIDSTTGLDRSTLSVTVQNGSGQAGVAGGGSDFLKSLGYNVTSAGNADNFDYTNLTISVKSAESQFLSLLKKDLATKYTVASSSSNLDNGFSSDALVIIGK